MEHFTFLNFNFLIFFFFLKTLDGPSKDIFIKILINYKDDFAFSKGHGISEMHVLEIQVNPKGKICNIYPNFCPRHGTLGQVLWAQS